MTRILLALLAGGMLAACAMPEPTANTQPLQEHDYITGSRIPAKNHNAQGTKRIEPSAIDRDEMFRPKATPMMGQ